MSELECRCLVLHHAARHFLVHQTNCDSEECRPGTPISARPPALERQHSSKALLHDYTYQALARSSNSRAAPRRRHGGREGALDSDEGPVIARICVGTHLACPQVSTHRYVRLCAYTPRAGAGGGGPGTIPSISTFAFASPGHFAHTISTGSFSFSFFPESTVQKFLLPRSCKGACAPP